MPLMTLTIEQGEYMSYNKGQQQHFIGIIHDSFVVYVVVYVLQTLSLLLIKAS